MGLLLAILAASLVMTMLGMLEDTMEDNDAKTRM